MRPAVRTMSPMHGRKVIERRVYPCWVIVEPAPDVKGKWVAHCLDFDTLSQADDAETAAKILIEATMDTILEDLMEGANPETRRAPDEDWAIIEQLVDAPQYGSFAELKEKMDPTIDRGRFVIGCQFVLTFDRLEVPEIPAEASGKGPARPAPAQPGRPMFPLRARKVRANSGEYACA